MQEPMALGQAGKPCVGSGVGQVGSGQAYGATDNRGRAPHASLLGGGAHVACAHGLWHARAAVAGPGAFVRPPALQRCGWLPEETPRVPL